MAFNNGDGIQVQAKEDINEAINATHHAVPQAAHDIGQHYHHSSHLAAAIPSSHSSGSSTGTVGTSPPAVRNFAEYTLTQHGISPQSLLPSQLALFSQANDDQRSRLIQLWQISPPDYASYGSQEIDDELGPWQKTSLEQEEYMAELRYKRSLSAQEHLGDRLDIDADLQGNSTTQTLSDHRCLAEPYITSGYEYLAQREYDQLSQQGYKALGGYVGRNPQAIDPVYRGREWWRHDVVGQSTPAYESVISEQLKFDPHTDMGMHGLEDEEML